MSAFSSSTGQANASPFLQVFPSPFHGDGVQATAPLPGNSTVLLEAPLCFLQTIENRQMNAICGGCNCFLGSLELQAQLLSRRLSRQDQQIISQGSGGSIVLCCNQCGELYCSESCRVRHWLERGHRLLCTGTLDATDPLVEFKMHAVRTNEIFLLVADIYAQICSNVERLMTERGVGLEEAVRASLPPLDSYVRQLWWDAAVAPRGSDPAELRETLQQLVAESWKLLDAALRLTERQLTPWLGPEYLARLVGMFEQNNVGVRRTSPLGRICQEVVPGRLENAQLAEAATAIASGLEEMAWEDCDEEDCADCDDDDDDDDDDEADDGNADGGDVEDDADADADEMESFKINDHVAADAHLVQLYEVLNSHGLESIFPPLDGTAFYSLICKINHSCEPNVLVRYDPAEPGAPLQARLTTLREIAPGEELLQSYIDQSLPYEARHAALLDYGFECACRKCASQL